MTSREKLLDGLIKDAISVLHHDTTEGDAIDRYERLALRKRFDARIGAFTKPVPAWESAKVSIDVSTCDDDAGYRVFGRVIDWQPDDDQGAIRLLCEYESDNFGMRRTTQQS
jgi:hypothetical protein